MLSRRSFVLAATAAALAPSALFSQAFAQGRAVGDIKVDLSRLRASGWAGQPLSVIDASLRRALAAAFGPGGGGPTLIVRVTKVTLGVNTGSGAGDRGRAMGESTSDYMEGELVLVGRNGSVIAQQPLLNALNSNSSGNWWSETNELNRLSALATSYGYWAKRQLG